MIVSLIAAISENGVIGKDGEIPWRLPADLKLFKTLTMGHHLIIGRRTYESIGKPLPGREMIVLTRKNDYIASGCQVASSMDEAMEIAEAAGDTEAFVAGGEVVYAQTLPIADRLYLSHIHATITGDTFFPAYDEQDWQITKEEDIPSRRDRNTPSRFRS
ncbi:MAG: dihydrofolate reductase [Anaerolineales bacterium]